MQFLGLLRHLVLPPGYPPDLLQPLLLPPGRTPDMLRPLVIAPGCPPDLLCPLCMPPGHLSEVSGSTSVLPQVCQTKSSSFLAFYHLGCQPKISDSIQFCLFSKTPPPIHLGLHFLDFIVFLSCIIGTNMKSIL